MTAPLLKSISLLYVEDEAFLRKATTDFLELHCGRVVTAENGRQALERVAAGGIDLILTDICMPLLDGLGLAEALGREAPEIPVVLYTAFSEVPYLIKGIQLGVAGFVPKPSEGGQLIASLEKAALPVVQRKRLQHLEDERQLSLEQLLGSGPSLKKLAGQVLRIAKTHDPILLLGETGTGKSRLAEIIHRFSSRSGAPFVTVQLGAIPEGLISQELFGHAQGAFPGADMARDGFLRSAAGGTLFFDDIDSAPPPVQALILQLVETGRFFPLGSTRAVTVDLRIIAASNRDLAADTSAGRFRQDLFFRLAGQQIALPPLRSIPEALPLLIERALRETSRDLGGELLPLSPAGLTLLQAQPWPGNIRQLRNLLKRAAVLAESEISAPLLESLLGPPEQLPHVPTANPLPADLPLTMAAAEHWALRRALEQTEGKLMAAARLLGMNYYTFRRHLARHGLDSDEA